MLNTQRPIRTDTGSTMNIERSTPGAAHNAADWHGPGGERGRRWRFRWSDLLWSLVYPSRAHRITPTVPGLVLIGLAFGIGSAAYNSSSNILFITLSLLLACLILSGVLSWLNLRGACWRLLLQPPVRAGQETPVTLELWNRKTLLPVHGLWFNVVARPRPAGSVRPEATITATSAEFKAAWTKAEQTTLRTSLHLRERLDPGGQVRLDWLCTPARRGRLRVELESVGSFYPFGFLRKNLGASLRREVLVWPAPVEYRLEPVAAAARLAEGERTARTGTGHDLLALRRYQAGDSHRLIHWKASARLRQIMVRQFAAEGAEGFFLRVETRPGLWPREEQFELLCSFAATLAEDFFTTGRLNGAAVNDEELIATRRVRDLESFLDRLAELKWEAGGGAPDAGGMPVSGLRFPFSRSLRDVITFAPDGHHGVAAFIDGEKTATA